VSLGLIGDALIGSNFFWPQPGVLAPDFFDRPSWERPTADNPYVPPLTEPDFSGMTPGFEGIEADEYSEDDPGFDGSLPPLTFWEQGDTADPNDGGTVVIVTPDGQVQSIAIRAERQEFYRVEVYTPDGDLVSRIPGWTRGRLTRVLDRASALSLTVPIGEEGVADLVRPNVIWLRDRWGFVIDTFQIQKRIPRGSNDASYVDIEAQGRITELVGEVILSYTEEDRIPVADHIAALLAFQERATPTPLGIIDPEIGDILRRFSCEDTNVHAALLQLQFTLPRDQRGRFYVDPQGRFNWRVAPGDNTEQVISRDLNVKSIEADIDYNGIVNRVFLYGEGNDPATRLALSGYVDEEANEYTEDYIEDAASIATYGLHPLIKQDRRVKYQDTLLRMANRILEEFAEPPTTITVELLDVAKSDNALPGWRDIEIGGKYRVTDAALGIESSVEIVEIQSDLARPVPIRVELTNGALSLADIINRIYEATVQPLDVDGDRYRSMGRNYSDTEPRNARAGDVRWNDAEDRPEMHDGSDWREIETDPGEVDPVWILADTVSALPAANTVPETQLARITTNNNGELGMILIVNPAKNGWHPLNFFG
jgi:hypothetical protein